MDLQLVGINPLFWIPYKLFINDLEHLEKLDGMYVIANNYINKIQLMGVVTMISRSFKSTTIILNDFSGSIKCYINEELKFNLGDLLLVTGKFNVNSFKVFDLVVQESYEAELLWWLDVLEARKNYEKEFIYPDRDTLVVNCL